MLWRINDRRGATHIQRVLAKLEVHSRAQAVGVALRHSSEDFAGHACGRELEPV